MKKNIFIFICILFSFVLPLFAQSSGQPAPPLSAGQPSFISDSPFQTVARSAVDTKSHYCGLLEMGDDALLARVHLIRAAKKSIMVQTYIWANDESGRFVLYELVQAAKRGVKVQIIIDQLMDRWDPHLIAFLHAACPRLEIKFYNPSNSTVSPSATYYLRALAEFKKFNQRMHNKVFIVDEQIAITGGRNYQNDYFDRGDHRNFKDRDVVVIGPVVNDMARSFNEYWKYRLSIPSYEMNDVQRLINARSFKRWDRREDYEFGLSFEALSARAQDNDYIKRHFVDAVVPVDNVVFLADHPGKNDTNSLWGGGLMLDAVLEFFSEAKKEIIIQTPYLVLDRGMRKFFKKFRRRHPDLNILVSSNSLAAADHFYAYAFSYKYKKFYVKNLRWRIFEFKNKPRDLEKMVPPVEGVKRAKNYFTCIHSKTFIVDDTRVYIGSFNLDPRSAHLNTEVGVIISGARFTRAVREYIMCDMAPANSWTIGPRKEVPVVAHVSGFMDDLMQAVPVVDIWPFTYTISFALRDGAEEVPFYDGRFYKNYRAVGPFPGVPLSEKEIKTRLIKSLFGPLEPLI